MNFIKKKKKEASKHTCENLKCNLKKCIPTICVLDMTLASAMAIGRSPLSPIMVTNSTNRSNLSANAVSASVSNSVPCCKIFVNTSMKAARV